MKYISEQIEQYMAIERILEEEYMAIESAVEDEPETT